jgi:hypothetical protein
MLKVILAGYDGRSTVSFSMDFKNVHEAHDAGRCNEAALAESGAEAAQGRAVCLPVCHFAPGQAHAGLADVSAWELSSVGI